MTHSADRRLTEDRDNAFAAVAPDAIGSDGALAGVAVSVKDILDVAGLPTRWGSRLMEAASPAEHDAGAVARLRAAGARIVAKTTTTEFAHSPLGWSPLTGLTRNPWNPAFTCGGSSAGAGVAVAAGLTPISLATDAGCSTRLPAALTGCWGLKPTIGRIAHERLPEGFATVVHLGIVAADVSLMARALTALAGPHPHDPMSLGHAPFTGIEGAGFEGARVLVWPRVGNDLVADETLAMLDAAEEALRRLGASVTIGAFGMANPHDSWVPLQQSGWAGRFGGLSATDRARLSASMRAGIDAGLALSARTLNAALIQRTACFRMVQSVFTAHDFILTPCTAAPAVAADHPPDAPLVIAGRDAGELRRAWLSYLSLFDLSGHPALAMPAGFDPNGVPMGVQLVGRWGGEAALLAAARAWETVRPAPALPS